MAARIVILADDLSGAADCAAACYRAGLKTKVCLHADGLGPPADALALDLDSRTQSPDQARTLTRATRPLIGDSVLYRKIDSTLRGHVAADIAATLEIGGPDAFAVVCPAYPATARALIGGQVYVGGQRLEDTEIWKLGGRGSTELQTLLAEVGLAPVALGLQTVRGPALRQAIETARAAGARAAICDAETDADLEAIVRATLCLRNVVWAGSGGLTIPLAKALSPARALAPEPVARRAGPILVAVGSASSISRRQLALLARDERVLTLAVAPQTLLEGPEGPGWRPASRALVAAVGKPGKEVVAIAIDPAAPVDTEVGPVLAAALGALVGRQLGRFGALVATGGETARAILDSAGVQSLCIRREIEPGVVLSDAGALPVVTKAGAFGQPDSLIGAVQALRSLPLAQQPDPAHRSGHEPND